MICPMCHRENPASAAFCINCGHPIADLNRDRERERAAQQAPSDYAPSDYDAAQPVKANDVFGVAPEPPTPTAPEPPTPAAPEPPASAGKPTDKAQGPRSAQGAPTAPDAPDSSSAAGAATQAHDGTDGLAVASLVCSIVGIFFFQIILPILGIIFGAVARNRNPKDSTNGKLALAGLIIGIIVLVLSVLAIAGLIVLGSMAVGVGAAYGLGL